MVGTITIIIFQQKQSWLHFEPVIDIKIPTLPKRGKDGGGDFDNAQIWTFSSGWLPLCPYTIWSEQSSRSLEFIYQKLSDSWGKQQRCTRSDFHHVISFDDVFHFLVPMFPLTSGFIPSSALPMQGSGWTLLPPVAASSVACVGGLSFHWSEL